MQKISIGTKNNLPEELNVKKILETALAKYPCPIFTGRVIIEKGAISHSHPILTIGTSWRIGSNRVDYIGMESEFPLLSVLETFVHEQFHWFLAAHFDRDVFDQLANTYPSAGDEYRYNKSGKYKFMVEMIVCFNTRNYLQKILQKAKWI